MKSASSPSRVLLRSCIHIGIGLDPGAIIVPSVLYMTDSFDELHTSGGTK